MPALPPVPVAARRMRRACATVVSVVSRRGDRQKEREGGGSIRKGNVFTPTALNPCLPFPIYDQRKKDQRDERIVFDGAEARAQGRGGLRLT